jgi:PAS domain-containing protein
MIEEKTLADLQTRIAELEQENARLQAALAESSACEEHLRQAEALYRTTAQFAYDWVYWETRDGIPRYVSPSCERIRVTPPMISLPIPICFMI